MDCNTRKRGKVKGVRIGMRDKKIVMVNLIIQKKSGTTTNNNLVCLGKVLFLLFSPPILVLALGILGLVGRSTAPNVGQLERETVEVFFLCSLVLWAIHYKLEFCCGLTSDGL
jgi:hypothetical protein